MTTSSSVRMKLGPVEFECMASEQFLKVELPVLIGGMAQLLKEHLADAKQHNNAAETDSAVSSSGTGTGIELTTTSIAAKLKVKTGPDLALAAALRLTRMNKLTFTRSELLERMREATTYFQQNYRKNLSAIIHGLVGTQKLLETATDTYALSKATKNELEGRLAQS